MKNHLMFFLLALYAAVVCIQPSMAQGAMPPSLRQQAARMLIVGFRGDSVGEDVRHYLQDIGVGGVILFDRDLTGDGTRGSRNIKSPSQLKTLCQALKNTAGRKLIVAIDEEGGNVDRLKTTYGFPPTVTPKSLGARNDSTATIEAAAGIARTLREAGINLNFAPSVDVDVNPACPIIGRLGRSFSSDTAVVAANAGWFVKAHRREGVATAIKHFPGHGSAASDSHLGLVDVSDTWSEAELAPFRHLIDAGLVDVVMTAHIYNSHLDSTYPATLSANVIGGLLRGKLGYDGVVASDDMYMEAIVSHFTLREAVVRAINAGVDLLVLGNNSPAGYSPERPDEVVDIIVDAVENGDIRRERIEEAVRRIDGLLAKLDF